MTYDLKWAEETAWAVIMAALTYIVGVAAAGMPTDHWQIWVMTLAAGAGRVVFATVIARLGAKSGTALAPATEYTTDPATEDLAQKIADAVVNALRQAFTPTVTADPTGTLPRPAAVSPPTSASTPV